MSTTRRKDTREKSSPETKLVNRMIDRLNKQGHLAWRNNTGTMFANGRWISYGKKGSGDIFVIVKPTGRFLSVEAKVGSNKATKQQQEWIEQVRSAGGVAGVANSMQALDRLVEEAADEGLSLF